MAKTGHVAMPVEIYEEVCRSHDLLGQWLRLPEVRKAIVLDEPTDLAAVQKVIATAMRRT